VYAVRAFGRGYSLVLGGVPIPHSHGIVAHSDGDVLLHALCDALLGAMGLGDIGQHFPDSDPRWKGADSRIFVRQCAALLRDGNWRLVNADLTLLAEAPRLKEHRAQIRANIAADLHSDARRTKVKAPACEGPGAIG